MMPVIDVTEKVRLRECAEIDTSRDRRGVTNPSKGKTKYEEKTLLGLALSGGGIRSATFNLGVLQTLEKLGWLKYFDYLSTVSGGGYIGSWTLANFKRKHAFPPPALENPPAVHHLRKYSRYLAPQIGFFSADTWVMAVIWLRNTSLIQTTLVGLLAAVLVLPRIWEWFFEWVAQGQWGWWAMASVFWTTAVVLVAANLRRLGKDVPGPPPWWTYQGCVQWGIVLPSLLAAAIIAANIWGAVTNATEPHWITITIAVFVVFLSAALLTHLSLPSDTKNKALYDTLVPLVCIAFLNLLLAGVAWLFHRWGEQCFGQGVWHAAVWATPMVSTALAQTVVLQIGLLGRAMPDDRREWWSRLRAWLGIYSLALLVIGVIGIYGPLLVANLQALAWTKRTVVAGWIATTLGGLLAGKNRETAGNKKAAWKEILALAAPYVFILGLLLIISSGLHWLLFELKMQVGWNPSPASPDCHCPPSAQLGQILNLCPCAGPPVSQLLTAYHWVMLNAANCPWPLWPAIILLVSAGIALLLAWRVDINEFSLNHFYRNRLVRAYLGASRDPQQRKENRFTGFDFKDDLLLSELRTTGEEADPQYNGPYPIINTALNLPNSSDLDLQDRKADSFILTPHFCGSNRTDYCPTGQFGATGGSIKLGTSVAISGAAASPNMGYHTSTAVAFLLTLFNVRLGWWVPNPRFQQIKRSSPRFGLPYLLTELFGVASDQDHFLYLSDGGHFDNLGIYELARRRCRLIVCGDAEADSEYKFEGLAGVIRKCRVDFDVHITIDVSQIRKQDSDKHNLANFAIGRIEYPDAPDGWLVYLKLSRTVHEDTDILQYALNVPEFPHESTGDQFFSESQFESYRRLGRRIAEDSLTPFVGALPANIEGILQELERVYESPQPTKPA